MARVKGDEKLKPVLDLLSTPPDSYTVQSCCLAYGGDSFSGPMKMALETHLSILRDRIQKLK